MKDENDDPGSGTGLTSRTGRTGGGVIAGYSFILLAALCWGSSGVIGKFWGSRGMADALLLSQARVSFSWLVLFVGLLLFGRQHLRISFREFLRFALLGIIGVAGANYLLYFAIHRMNVAVADLIQFMAPLLVSLYLWFRGVEKMDWPKASALALSLVGSGLALGVAGGVINLPPIAVAAALGSAFCYAFLLVYGKDLTRDYSMWTFLHFALLTATLFWAAVNPPHLFAQHLREPAEFGRLFGFAMLSIFLPYVFFFIGLKRVPASRAGIVSTFEPVVMAVGSWLALGDPLSRWQVVGVMLVLVAIAVVEVTSGDGGGGVGTIEESFSPQRHILARKRCWRDTEATHREIEQEEAEKAEEVIEAK